MSFRRNMKQTGDRVTTSQEQQGNVLNTAAFSVSDNIKSEFDMWSWIYQEIANLRVEVSRLGTYVRVNNRSSPDFLDAYHAHLYSLLLPVSVVIPDVLWNKIEQLWLEYKTDIDKYYILRKSVPNAKIPFSLIKKLDGLYRASLLMAQKAGLGFKVTVQQDIENAIEKAITVSHN